MAGIIHRTGCCCHCMESTNTAIITLAGNCRGQGWTTLTFEQYVRNHLNTSANCFWGFQGDGGRDVQTLDIIRCRNTGDYWVSLDYFDLTATYCDCVGSSGYGGWVNVGSDIVCNCDTKRLEGTFTVYGRTGNYNYDGCSAIVTLG